AGGHRYHEEWRELTNTVTGIDVSTFQGTIDWPTAKRAGVAFGIARVSDGLFLDDKFARNWQMLRSNGVVRGVYQFFRASKDPVKQADLLVDRVGKLQPGDLPPVLDAEEMDGVSPAVWRANMNA